VGDAKLQFLVTPAHLEIIKNLRFTMLTTNHVATGIQPFQFPEEALEGTTNAQALYEALYAGSSAPSLADLDRVMQAKPGAPKALYQVRHQVHHVYLLLAILFGEEHHLTQAYGNFYQRFLSSEAELHRHQQGLTQARDQLLFPTKLLK
jgi:hypothetical protein